jgi:hypothetical protein
MAKFAVGEIAILASGHQAWSPYFGLEVEVIAIRTDAKCRYLIKAEWIGKAFDCADIAWASEYNLRKRPQPPDWNALSNPEEVPIRELA